MLGMKEATSIDVTGVTPLRPPPGKFASLLGFAIHRSGRGGGVAAVCSVAGLSERVAVSVAVAVATAASSALLWLPVPSSTNVGEH
jgi:hypothetical protein